MSQDTYTVAALAAEVGVPRTTINDWLSRYDNFIDAIAIGKRKVYPESALEVLKTIAGLRDSGKSSAEIEQILAQNHGIRPEVASGKVEKSPADTPDAAVADDSPVGAESNLPVLNDASGPVNLPALQNIERSAMELAGFIADLRKQQLQSIKRSRRVSLLLLTAIVLLLAAFALIYMAMRNEFAVRSSEAAAMQKNMQQLNAELSAMERARAAERTQAAREAAAWRQKVSELAGQREAMNEQIKSLNKQLALMDKALKRADARAAEESARYARELREVRAAFDAERSRLQQILREQQQALRTQDSRHQQALQQKLSHDARAARERLQELQQKLDVITAKLEKLTAPESPAVPAAPAAPKPAAPAVKPAADVK